MSKKKRTPRTRTLTRKADAQAEKLLALREQLARMSPGGSPEWAIEVESAAVVELRATRETCIACGSALKVAAHEIEDGSTALLRRVQLACSACGRAATRYFVMKPVRMH